MTDNNLIVQPKSLSQQNKASGLRASEVIIGIDLGTTNSEAGVWIDGRIEIIEVDGSKIMPSYVGLDNDGKLIVGTAARNQYPVYPERTIRSIKRKMGTDERTPLGDKSYLPQEISAMILRRLKTAAEATLGCQVNKAVITVPAQFNDAQRQATRDAGAIAGLEVVRIINEPTAACLAYEAAKADKAKRILAFDLGGGTFDVSIVIAEGDIVEVAASHGDNHLGGDDMDALIADWASKTLYDRQSTPGLLSKLSEHRLTRAAETAKIHLTDFPHARIIEANLPLDSGAAFESIDAELARAEFEKMIAPLIDRMLLAVHKSLADAKLKPGQIDEIVLVGGATRVPLIQGMLERELGKRPRADVHPDLAVAYGAGIMAARLMGESKQKILVDITPYTFGVSSYGVVNGEWCPYKFSPIVKAGTPLPTVKAESFCTMQDEQEAVEVRVFQGEDPDARENILVGSFHVEGLSKRPAGNEIDMSMRLDLDGILHVSAIEKATGLTKGISIQDSMAKLTPEQVAKSKMTVASLFDSSAFNTFPTDDESDESDKSDKSHDSHKSDKPKATGKSVKADPYDQKLAVFRSRIAAASSKMDSVDKADADRLISRMSDAAFEGNDTSWDNAAKELEDILFFMESK